ncbi:MAG: T9SS type A sorting domain-containing protein [Bacteroidia bacterium]|nr:T9SS type A sorting domain-containing protein [Bacteroidia bacterium]
MKKSLLVLLASASFFCNAQYHYNLYSSPGINPGNLNSDGEYPSGSGLPATWTVIQNPSATPAWSPNQTIPFTFDFNSTPFTQYKVSTSGVLTFDLAAATAPSYTNTAVPTAGMSDNSVFVWGNAGTGTNDKICSKTFGTAPNRQHWVMFSSYSNGSEYTYWSIVLEETTNKIYLVDQRHSNEIQNLTVGIQINATTAYAVNAGANDVITIAGGSATPLDNAYYEFIQGATPSYDMTVLNKTVQQYLILSQAPFTMQGVVSNFGSQNVTSFDLNYSVNGGTTVTAPVTAVNITPQDTELIYHPGTWTPATTGTYSVSLWASNINGNGDMYTMNDTLDFTINVVDTFCVRKPLMEVFTSATCGPCVAGNLNMENNVIPNISNYTVIKYQQNFPGAGDPYQTTEATNRRSTYYSISSIPRMEIDGQWDGNAAGLSVPIYNSYAAEPAFVEIAITNATYNGTIVQVDATIKPLINFNGTNYSYHVVVIEKSTTGNVATNGETIFHNVMMDMIPTETGTAAGALTALNTINVSKSADMAGTFVEDITDLKAVVFLQSNSDKKILQSEWMDISQFIGISENKNGESALFKLFPNPAQDFVQLVFSNDANKNIEITNVMGQVITNKNTADKTVTLSTSDLSAGIYFVTAKMADTGKKQTYKLIVKK